MVTRGTAPALPISGTTKAVFPQNIQVKYPDYDGSNSQNLLINSNYKPANAVSQYALQQGVVQKTLLDDNTVNLSSATTFNVNDLRLAFQIQRWMERNARAGSRYTEFLKAHFGVSPRDERLQRPEYIGGSKAPIIFSSTSNICDSITTHSQGNLAGHGIGISSKFCGKYHVKEYGLIMGIMSVMPKPVYQQGINRQWLRRTKYDFYFPEFAHLSEQAIHNCELYISHSTDDSGTFGFQGRYDEMRYKPSMVCSKMRSTYDTWHLARQFGSLPLLNDSFLQCVPRKDCFAVNTEPGLIVSFGNVIKAYRPIPISAEPGLIDH